MPRQCQRLSVTISASGGCAKWLPPSQRIITNHWLCISTPRPLSPPPPPLHPAPPLPSKEVPSVSDSGASAIYSECSKQICHFCIWRAGGACILPLARLFVVMRDIKRAVIYILSHLHFFSKSTLCPLLSITQAAGQNNSSFSLFKGEWTKIQYPGEYLVLL